MLTVHCGFKPWDVDQFYYPDYKDCIKELGIKLNYESISHILGNGYATDAGELVNDSNPFNYSEKKSGKGKPQRMTKEMALAFVGMQK